MSDHNETRGTMSEIDDAAFERAYQRMMLRRNLETLKRESEGGWDWNEVAVSPDVERFMFFPTPLAFVEDEGVVGDV